MTLEKIRNLLLTLIFLFIIIPLSALEINNPHFSTPLPIPHLLRDENPETPELEVTLTAGKGSVYFFNETRTPTFGYNGDFLGPTIRAARGQKVKITVTNELTETTTVHWHGLHVPAEMDGGPCEE